MATSLDLQRLPRTLSVSKENGRVNLEYIDQRALPQQLSLCKTDDWMSVVDAIKILGIRGAPAIGVAGVAALALYACNGGDESCFAEVANVVETARPTAVNLSWAVGRALKAAEGLPWSDVGPLLYDMTVTMIAEDEATNRRIGDNGAKLLAPHFRVLTHCNAGSLATCFYGTALGVVYSAAQQGKIDRVFADETRPVGQGARLTAWELSHVDIPVTLICDNMAASLMASGAIDAVIVGADRIARNGDTANKIGTYGVAVLAREHGIPFYVAAPFSTIDPSLADGTKIIIEQRDASEVLPEPIDGVEIWNPAFDVTPGRYVSAFITEEGCFTTAELEKRLSVDL